MFNFIRRMFGRNERIERRIQQILDEAHARADAPAPQPRPVAKPVQYRARREHLETV